MADIVKEIVPVAYEAFEDYVLNSRNFTSAELNALGKLLKGELKTDNLEESLLAGEHNMSKREIREFNEKVQKLVNP
jgi:hypothetical protein